LPRRGRHRRLVDLLRSAVRRGQIARRNAIQYPLPTQRRRAPERRVGQREIATALGSFLGLGCRETHEFDESALASGANLSDVFADARFSHVPTATSPARASWRY